MVCAALDFFWHVPIRALRISKSNKITFDFLPENITQYTNILNFIHSNIKYIMLVHGQNIYI